MYGSKEFLKFVLLAAAASCAAAWLLLVFAYALSASAAHAEAYLYTPIAGFHGVTAALLVALKQARSCG